MKKLPPKYDPKEAEKRLQLEWEKKNIYGWRNDKPRNETYVIDTPPPTVSGVLHMGHIFSYTQADFIARYKRMKGMDVFYPMGFDDNGLPTERLVEKVKNIRGASMEREKFVAICREVIRDAEEEFEKLFKSVALSVDWKEKYQTISDEVRKLSQASFLDLVEKDITYHHFSPTYWDIYDRTAIAQAEVENKELPSKMNNVEFSLDDGSKIVIATTRPELIVACVAVIYHPDDPNAEKYKNKKAITALFGAVVPMIEDSKVDLSKGTGLVMCCTFGDDTDKEWQEKYNLPIRRVVGKDGRLINLEKIGEEGWPVRDKQQAQSFAKQIPIKALSVRKEVREKMIELLKNAGLLLSQTDIIHTEKCAERSGMPIEIIVTNQWYIKVLDKKDELLKRASQCTWFPSFMKLRLEQWIENLKYDWCISRQRFFGVPFPVWFLIDDEGKLIKKVYPNIHNDTLPVDPSAGALPYGYKGAVSDSHARYNELDHYPPEERKHHRGYFHESNKIIKAKEITTNNEVKFVIETDVMDTWATSSISPQINSHGIGKYFNPEPERHAKLFPADLRPQAHEIIRTWAFYTIVKAYLHEDTIPWKNLMISGWCLAPDKTKMSKSKGNVVTPASLIEEQGADAVRYWASTSRLGADTAFSEDVLKIGKRLVNKLWNASNFASIHIAKLKKVPETIDLNIITEPMDRWLISRLHHTIKIATEEFERYEYCDARVAIEEFFWKDFCDNYLEIVKVRTYQDNLSAIHTIYFALEAVLRLFAPFVPHVTEEIYSYLFNNKHESLTTIHARGNWLDTNSYPADENAEVLGTNLINILEEVRKLKAAQNLSIKWPIEELQIRGEFRSDFEAIKQDLLNVTCSARVTITPSEDFEVSAILGKTSDTA